MLGLRRGWVRQGYGLGAHSLGARVFGFGGVGPGILGQVLGLGEGIQPGWGDGRGRRLRRNGRRWQCGCCRCWGSRRCCGGCGHWGQKVNRGRDRGRDRGHPGHVWRRHRRKRVCRCLHGGLDRGLNGCLDRGLRRIQQGRKALDRHARTLAKRRSGTAGGRGSGGGKAGQYRGGHTGLRLGVSPEGASIMPSGRRVRAPPNRPGAMKKAPRSGVPLPPICAGVYLLSSSESATKRGSPPLRTSISRDLRPASLASAIRSSRSAIVATFCCPASVITSPMRRPFS